MNENSKRAPEASRIPLFQSHVQRLRVFPSGVSPVVSLRLGGCWQQSQSFFYLFPPGFNFVLLSACGCLSSQFWSHLLLPGGTGSPSIWTALFFPASLTSPLLHNHINLVVTWEYLVIALLCYSPTKSCLAWIFPCFQCIFMYSEATWIAPTPSCLWIICEAIKKKPIPLPQKRALACCLVCVPSKR